MNPLELLREAQRAVPAMRYAFGVVGLAAAVAIVAGLQIDMRIAVFGSILVIGLMFILIVFSALAAHSSRSLLPVALLAAWSFTLLTIAASALLMTSYFFSWPIPISGYLPNETEKQQISTEVDSADLTESRVSETQEEPLCDKETRTVKINYSESVAINDFLTIRYIGISSSGKEQVQVQMDRRAYISVNEGAEPTSVTDLISTYELSLGDQTMIYGDGHTRIDYIKLIRSTSGSSIEVEWTYQEIFCQH